MRPLVLAPDGSEPADSEPADAVGDVAGDGEGERVHPTGRAAVEAALIAAAAQLFEVTNPSSVTVRQIAERANVNHGLIHQYFGSKGGLLAAVMDTLAEEAVRRWGEGVAFDPASAMRRYIRVTGRAILDGYGTDVGRRGYPAQVMLERAARDVFGLDPRSARIRSAQALALGMGWMLFEPMLVRAAQIEDEPAGILQDELQKAIISLATPVEPLPAASAPAGPPAGASDPDGPQAPDASQAPDAPKAPRGAAEAPGGAGDPDEALADDGATGPSGQGRGPIDG